MMHPTIALMPVEDLQVHQRIAAEAAKVPVMPSTIGQLFVLMGKGLLMFHRDLLLAVIDVDLAGAANGRE
jgi:hypothetical protein